MVLNFKRKILPFLLAGAWGLPATANEAPRLVVSIVVDQLRSDYLHYFRSTFGEKGFKRLQTEGLSCHSVNFGFPNLSQSASTTVIYTGAYPCHNGITGDYQYNPATDRETSIVADNRYLGNYTSDRFSPRALLASTVGDELKIASQGQSLVYAIAPNAAEAILAGGTYANGAFWLDDYSGKWATSTYYKDFPAYVDRFNATEAIGNYTEKHWTQSCPHYAGLPCSNQKKTFSHKFTKANPNRFIEIKQTALINTEITNLALCFLENAGLGARLCSDMLALTYYAGNCHLGPEQEEYTSEIQDTYYRLDRELERLFEAIDQKVGLKHTLILLTSTGYYDAPRRLPPGFAPVGEFHPNRCTALLNLYLMALYGQGNWVSAYHNRQIFLNKKLTEDQQISWSDFVHNAAEFVSQFSGVQDIVTAGQWYVDDQENAAARRRGVHKNSSGHLLLELQPGWVIVDDKALRKEPDRDVTNLAPLFLLGQTIRRGPLERPIPATAIAPSLAFLLRIRTPNACREPALPEIVSSYPSTP
jgi:hypothetical protein